MAGYYVWSLLVLNIFLKPVSPECENEMNELTSLVMGQTQMISELTATLKNNLDRSMSEICLEMGEIKRNTSLCPTHVACLTKTGTEIQTFDKQLIAEALDSIDKVAFYAYMGSDFSIHRSKTIIFDAIQLNLGQGYNNNTGVFTVPKRGLYIFSLTLHPYGRSHASVQLMVNHEIKGVVFMDSSEGWQTTPASTSIPVWANQGDVVFVRTHPTWKSTGSFHSTDPAWTSFAGWKI